MSCVRSGVIIVVPEAREVSTVPEAREVSTVPEAREVSTEIASTR